jgi:hypothetical protein
MCHRLIPVLLKQTANDWDKATHIHYRNRHSHRGGDKEGHRGGNNGDDNGDNRSDSSAEWKDEGEDEDHSGTGSEAGSEGKGSEGTVGEEKGGRAIGGGDDFVGEGGGSGGGRLVHAERLRLVAGLAMVSEAALRVQRDVVVYGRKGRPAGLVCDSTLQSLFEVKLEVDMQVRTEGYIILATTALYG